MLSILPEQGPTGCKHTGVVGLLKDFQELWEGSTEALMAVRQDGVSGIWK